MTTLFRWLLRLVLVVAGLVFAASLLVVAALLILVWGLGAAWARLTGRPVTPFVMRVNPRGGFNRMYRARQRQGAQPSDLSPVTQGRKAGVDVTDVVPKLPRA